MVFLVTGASGFIGGAITKYLLSNTGVKIYLLCRNVSSANIILEKNNYNKNLIPLVGSLENFPLDEIILGEIDTCIHCAWISTPGEYLNSEKNYDFLKWSNSMVKNLVEMGIKHITVLGTCFEYKLGDELMNEEETLSEVRSEYSECKIKHYEYLKEICSKNNVSYTWGRVFYPFGVGEPQDKFCSFAIKKLKSGGGVTINTPHDEKDYIYIDDLAEAIVVSTQKKHNGIINLGTGKGVRIIDLANSIAKLLGVSQNKIKIPQHLTPTSTKIIADNSKLKLYNWKPKTSLIEGLTKLIKAIK